MPLGLMPPSRQSYLSPPWAFLFFFIFFPLSFSLSIQPLLLFSFCKGTLFARAELVVPKPARLTPAALLRGFVHPTVLSVPPGAGEEGIRTQPPPMPVAFPTRRLMLAPGLSRPGLSSSLFIFPFFLRTDLSLPSLVTPTLP